VKHKIATIITTFSISVSVLRHTLRTSLHFASVTSNVVNYYAWHPPDLPLTVGQERSSGNVLSRSAGRMFATVSLLL